jgi:octaprenyl-diphosphate synthase
MIYALESATADERRTVETVVADGNYDQAPFMKVLQILDRHQAVSRAYERAHNFTEKSREMIASFPDSPAQRALQAMVELVTERSS